MRLGRDGEEDAASAYPVQLAADCLQSDDYGVGVVGCLGVAAGGGEDGGGEEGDAERQRGQAGAGQLVHIAFETGSLG